MSSFVASPRSSISSDCAHVRHEQTVDDEAWRVLAGHRNLAARPRRTSGPRRTRRRSVASVRTTSTSFISWTGLKKCRPTKRSGSPRSRRPISPIGNEEVFDAKIVRRACTIPSEFGKQLTSSTSRSSTIASIDEVAIGQRLNLLQTARDAALEASATWRSPARPVFAQPCPSRRPSAASLRRAALPMRPRPLIERNACSALDDGDHSRIRPGRRPGRCRDP